MQHIAPLGENDEPNKEELRICGSFLILTGKDEA